MIDPSVVVFWPREHAELHLPPGRWAAAAAC